MNKNKVLYHAANRVLNKKEFTTPYNILMSEFFEEFQRRAPESDRGTSGVTPHQR